MKIRAYSLVTFLAGMLSLLLVLRFYPPPDLTAVVFLAVMSFVAEWLALSLPYGGTISLSFSMHLAAVLLGGPATGALVALLSSVPPQDIQERRAWYRVAFNIGQLTLSTSLAGLAFVLVGGVPLGSSSASSSLGAWVAAGLVAALVRAAANSALVGVAISLSSGERLLRVWDAIVRPIAASVVALTLLGIIMAVLIGVAGLLSSLLLFVPFFVSRRTLLAYQELSDAYRDTLRSLVTLIEAKDPYTRGHSERVAVYSRGIAEVLGVSQSDAQSIEYAALLHDVGKVGVAAATLTKPGALSAEEYDEVKLHPVTAARVLADVELLEDTLPLIEAHHERLDGSGYPYGLRDENIPQGAQVLAVADSFDAMTSTRSYRPAMSHKDALAELELESDHRLASDCVEALHEAILAGEFAELSERGYEWEAETQ